MSVDLASRQSPTRASLRALLRKVALSDTDLQMLCIDHLPELMPHMSSAMSYDALLNVLLHRVEPRRLLKALVSCESLARAVAEHQRILAFELAPEYASFESPSPGADTSGELPTELSDPLDPEVIGASYVPAALPSARQRQSWPPGRILHRPPPPKSAYDAAWYLVRTEEQERAHAAWEAPGAPVVLQAPERFGKTWLLMHLLAQLRARGPTIYCSLKALGEEASSSFSAFLCELARRILESCALPAALLDIAWGRSSSPEANWNWLLATHVLPSAGTGSWLILALDGIDAIAEKPYFDRFLTLLRGMAEAAAFTPWDVLRLGLTLSSTVALRGQDIHRSPLENVAQIITLQDLPRSQVAQLAGWYGLGLDSADALSEQVGGHPFLVHLALHEAQHRRQSVAEVLLPSSRVFEPYLQVCRKRLMQQPELHQALRAVIFDEHAALDERHATRLIDAGFLTDDYDVHGRRVLRLSYRLFHRLA